MTDRENETTPHADDDVAGFDQTNAQVRGLSGDSDGTVEGEQQSEADRGEEDLPGVRDA